MKASLAAITAMLTLGVTGIYASDPAPQPEITVNTYTVVNEGSDTIAVRGFTVVGNDTMVVRGFAVLEPLTPAPKAPETTVPADTTQLASSDPVFLPIDKELAGTFTWGDDLPGLPYSGVSNSEPFHFSGFLGQNRPGMRFPSIQMIKTAPSKANKADGKSAVKRLQMPDPFVTDGVLGHFTWGLDLGSGVDCTARNMTQFHFGGYIGYKDRWMRLLGAGVDIMSMINNQSRCYPLFAIVRTSFSPYYQFCFAEVKAGVSFNNFSGYESQTGFYGSLGIGFTLAHSRTFSSHLMLRYTAMPVSTLHYTSPEGDPLSAPGYLLSYACIGIGVAF